MRYDEHCLLAVTSSCLLAAPPPPLASLTLSHLPTPVHTCPHLAVGFLLELPLDRQLSDLAAGPRYFRPAADGF